MKRSNKQINSKNVGKEVDKIGSAHHHVVERLVLLAHGFDQQPRKIGALERSHEITQLMNDATTGKDIRFGVIALKEEKHN